MKSARELSAVAALKYWGLIQKSNGCWTWCGTRDAKGYGLLYADNTKMRASHIAWFFEHGAFPTAGLLVCHHCDNPPCVRPDHLFLGTARDNAKDAARKGRLDPQLQKMWSATLNRHRARTHCKHGHPLKEPNLLPNKKGFRRCKECSRLDWSSRADRMKALRNPKGVRRSYVRHAP